MKKLTKELRVLTAFSNLKCIDVAYYIEIEKKGIHLLSKSNKKYLYIPNRELSIKNCYEFLGCEAYSFLNDLENNFIYDQFCFWKEALSKLSLLLFKNSEDIKYHPVLKILQQMLDSGESWCADFKMADKIYQELKPYESLAREDFVKNDNDVFVWLKMLLEKLELARKDGILTWTDEILC